MLYEVITVLQAGPLLGRVPQRLRGERDLGGPDGRLALVGAAELAADHDLFQVTYKVKQPLQKRLMSSVDGALEKLDAAGWRRKFESGLPR